MAEPVTALAESANLDCQKNQPSRFCWLSGVVESDRRAERGGSDGLASRQASHRAAERRASGAVITVTVMDFCRKSVTVNGDDS